MGNMDMTEVEESVFAISDAKLHKGMCKRLSSVVCKVMAIFPMLEEARPRCRSGIQALCSLHLALEKSKNLLQHCADCSKFYLAITGNSILLKFEKARYSLEESLRRVEDIVPQAIGCHIIEIVSELQGIVFALDQSEKQVGDDVIMMLHQEKNGVDGSVDVFELEAFHQAATKLGITSSRAALTERRSLKKLIDRARSEEDKRKESIVSYLLFLMRKYSKLFRNECSDDGDSQGSTPCSPTIQGSSEQGFVSEQVNAHQIQKVSSSLVSKLNGMRSCNSPIVPEEFRCPISLQLMYDPVIVASGQTYERVCIEKWFCNGHDTCPKTQQRLSHLGLTSNYCVKSLIASWCEQTGVNLPEQPPDCLDESYYKWTSSHCETSNSGSIDSIKYNDVKGEKVVPFEEEDDFDGPEKQQETRIQDSYFGNLNNGPTQRYTRLLAVLESDFSIDMKRMAVEEIRLLLKDDEEARFCMADCGFVEALMTFLSASVDQKNEEAQETGTMALFNLAVNSDRNKGLMINAGVVPLLLEVQKSISYEAATALYVNLSTFPEANDIIGSSGAIPFLVSCLRQPKMQCRFDALQAIYNLSTLGSNVPRLVAAGAIPNLACILHSPANSWDDKVIACLCHLSSHTHGRNEIISYPGLISSLASFLDSEKQVEQEHAVSCLLKLCTVDDDDSDRCSELILQEGVIPSLVSLTVNGTPRGKDKAQKLLVHFRELRERASENGPGESTAATGVVVRGREVKKLSKSSSKRLGRTLSAIWKLTFPRPQRGATHAHHHRCCSLCWGVRIPGKKGCKDDHVLWPDDAGWRGDEMETSTEIWGIEICCGWMRSGLGLGEKKKLEHSGNDEGAIDYDFMYNKFAMLFLKSAERNNC